VVAAGGPEAAAALAAADVVVCATTAREPVLSATAVAGDVIVIAVGSHEPGARELDAALLGRAAAAGGVVVEDRATALREAGDIVLARDEGALDPAALVPMADVATGRTRLPDHGPVVFKSVGMSWQDLVIATAVMERTRA
jgi:ornithine cyclodeaminase